MNREFLENNIVNINSDKFESTFLNDWSYVLIDPDLFFGEEPTDNGIDILRDIENVSADSRLFFYLTTFSDIEIADWDEGYSTSSISASNKTQWQFAFSGMYFTSTSLKWCGVYLDTLGQECVVIGADRTFIEKLKSNIKGSSILDSEFIISIQEDRAYNKQINQDK